MTGIGPAIWMRRRISVSSGGNGSVIGRSWSRGRGRAERRAPPRHQDEGDAGEHQRYRQQHSHGEALPEKSELRIGLAEQLAEYADHPVAEREGPDDVAGPFQ